VCRLLQYFGTNIGKIVVTWDMEQFEGSFPKLLSSLMEVNVDMLRPVIDLIDFSDADASGTVGKEGARN